MRLNDEELELVSIARGQNIDEMVAVIEHIAAARVAAALEAERVRLGMTALTHRHREVRVEDELWEAAAPAAKAEGTTRSEVMREALRQLVERHAAEVSMKGVRK